MSNILNLKGVKLLAISVLAVAMLATFGMVAVQTAGAAECSITSTLRVGSKGDQVKCLQATVGVVADGSFGPKTKAAVMAWQSSVGLVADGVFGPKSRAAWSGGGSTSMMYPAGCTSTSGYSPTTGTKCDSGTMTTTLPAGCTSTSGFSTTTGVSCSTGAVVGATGTGIGVNLSTSNPAAATLPDGSAYNKVLALNLTGSTTGAVNVTGLRLTRSGFSLNSDFSGVLVMDANGARHGNVVTIFDSGSGDTALVQFANDPIIVPAGSSTTVWVLANISAAQTTSGTFAFGVNSAADVMTANSATVSGSFPITGNVFSVIDGSSFLGALDVDASTISASARSVDLGAQDYIIGKFKFYENSSKEDIWVNSVRLYNNGNTTDADLSDLKLTNDSTGEVLAVATGTTNKYVLFTLANPLKILKGQNKTLAVVADVVNGSSRTAQFIIQNDYDISATGVSTGGGLLATHSTNVSGDASTGFPIGEAANYNTITITQGSLTVTKDNTSSSTDLSQGQVGAVLGVWKIEATGEDIELQKADLSVTGTSVAADFSGSVSLVAVSATGAETTIYSTSTLAPLFDDDAAGTDQATLSNYYLIPSNTSIKVKLVANLSSSATNALTAIGNFGDVYYRRISTNNYATASDDAFVTANTRTISTATVTVAKNSSYGNQNIVAGCGCEVKIGSYIIQAGSSEGVNVSAINVDMSAVTGWTQMKLKKVNTDGTETVIGSTVTSPSTTDDANSFSVGGQLNVAASSSVVVNVYANASATAVTVNTDIDASDVTASGLSSGSSLSTIPATAVTGQTITVQTAGTLLVESEGSLVEGVIHSSQSGIDLLKLKFTSQYEAIDISKLVFQTKSGDANLSTLSITAGAATFSASVIKGVATFTGLTLQVPKDSTLSITVRGAFNSSGTLVSAESVRVGLTSMIATGTSGNRVYERSRTTTGSAGDIAADTATALTVGSTEGFNVGDVVQVNTAGGVSAFTGVVTTVGSATSLTVAGPDNLADCASATCYVTKWATREATTSTTTTATITDLTSTAIDVTSTRGFVAGDIAFIEGVSGGVDDGNFYTVVSVTDGNTMNVLGVGKVTASPTIGTTATDRVTRMATSTSTTTNLATDDIAANVNGATSTITVASTLGFDVGDVVVLNSTGGTATAQPLYVVSAVPSATTITLIGKMVHTNIPVGSFLTELVTTNTTTVSTASTITADTVSAVTLTSTAGFAVGDIVMIADDTAASAGVDVYSVTAVTSTTISVVGETGIVATAGTFVTRLASVTANGKPYTVHDVEPVITNSAIPSGGQSANQIVGVFDIKADGDVALTIKALTLTRGGNIGTRVAVGSQPKIYDYSSGSLGALLGTGGDWSGTTAGSTSAITLDTPYDVSAGTTLRVAVTVNTASAVANDTFQVYIDNTSGLAGLFGGLSWYYVASSPSPGTEPTNASPATLSDSYPVYASTLSY